VCWSNPAIGFFILRYNPNMEPTLKTHVNTYRLDVFMEEYERQLRKAFKEKPNEYFFSETKIPKFVGRVRESIQNLRFIHDGPSMIATCKALGIKNTKESIIEFVTTNAQPILASSKLVG